MAFADKREAAFWLDQSGNNNDWTGHSLTESDISVDSPTNNFCTLNPLHRNANMTYSEGNTKYTATYTNSGCMSSFGIPLGTKFYWEFVQLTWGGASGDSAYIGVNTPSVNLLGSLGGYITSHSYVSGSGNSNTTTSQSAYGASWGTNDIIGIAIDRVNHTLEFFKNGSSQGTFSISATEEHFPWFGSGGGNTHANAYVNFGQDSSFAGNKTAQGKQDSNDIGDFYYTPPTGFLSLCTKNLPDVAVIPSEHFNTVLYTGNSSTNNITGVGFQPDFVWLKSRNAGYSPAQLDSIRGTNKWLASDQTIAEGTWSSDFNSFDSDGFGLGWSGGTYGINKSSTTYVAWNWKANGTGVSNTSGSITSTVSANADAGFSIVSWTGNATQSTVGHGLSSAPQFVIVKNRIDGDTNWQCWNKSIPDHSIILNSANAKDTDGPYLFGDNSNVVDPTPTVFTVGANNQVNGTSDGMIAYCFHSVDGYSKVGSYTGNGNADGTFVYTGFRPAYVMIKRTDSADGWLLVDSERVGYNAGNNVLEANVSDAEDSGVADRVDMLSNGFKLNSTWSKINASGGNYIFLSFAESPFKHTNAR
jgi:hypothetical protein